MTGFIEKLTAIIFSDKIGKIFEIIRLRYAIKQNTGIRFFAPKTDQRKRSIAYVKNCRYIDIASLGNVIERLRYSIKFEIRLGTE